MTVLGRLYKIRIGYNMERVYIPPIGDQAYRSHDAAATAGHDPKSLRPVLVPDGTSQFCIIVDEFGEETIVVKRLRLLGALAGRGIVDCQSFRVESRKSKWADRTIIV